MIYSFTERMLYFFREIVFCFLFMVSFLNNKIELLPCDCLPAKCASVFVQTHIVYVK